MPLPKSFRTILQQNTVLVFPVEQTVASCLPAEAQPDAPRQTPNPITTGLAPATRPGGSPQPAAATALGAAVPGCLSGAGRAGLCPKHPGEGVHVLPGGRTLSFYQRTGTSSPAPSKGSRFNPRNRGAGETEAGRCSLGSQSITGRKAGFSCALPSPGRAMPAETDRVCLTIYQCYIRAHSRAVIHLLRLQVSVEELF